MIQHLKKMVLLILLLSSSGLVAQNQLDFGVNFQKSYHFIWENGITVAYSSPKLVQQKLQIGANLLSSNMGSAFSSNAIRQEQIVLFGRYFFTKKYAIQPFGQLNFGYLKAHFDQTYFSELPSQSALLSVQFGAQATVKKQYNALASVGYNAITGSGGKGVGTIYPLFFQLSLTYSFDLKSLHPKPTEEEPELELNNEK